MKQTLRTTAALLCLILPNYYTDFRAAAQSPRPPAPIPPALPAHAPVPAQIATSHTVFLSNLGADASFPADATRVYNDIYKALESWGHYKLARAPDQADLVFELRDVSTLSTSGMGDNIYTINTSTFQLAIVDPKSRVTLWTITSPVALAGRRQSRDRWLSIAERNLISRIKVVSGQPLDSKETADLTTTPAMHRGRAVLLIGGGTAALAVGSYFLFHHLSQNSLAEQKASQDAFCNANHIPLSQCAGG